jgi:thiamine biosynthesis lipoprotein
MRADASFAVMGSAAEVTVVDGPRSLVEQARRRLTALERRWSRFVPTSDVSRMNRAAGSPVAVSPETRLLVRRALEGHAVSSGAFDPTVLGAMLRNGYSASYEQLGERGRPEPSPLVTGATGIEIDDATGTVRLPARVGFDPGGIGKGLAADLVAGELLAAGAAGVCVNVGGDVRVGGVAPGGDAWRIAVDGPRPGSPPLAVVRLHDGAVATSSRLRRRWTSADGSEGHHLVDPRTGTSAWTPVLAATAVAGEGWQADVLAKVAFLDVQHGLGLADALGAAALVAVADGLLASSSWWAVATPPAVPEVAR